MPVSYHIENSTQKCIKDLNIRAKTLKFLERTQGINLSDLELGKAFLDT